METLAHDGVLELMERLLARARAAQQDTGPEVPRLMPGLQHRLRKTEELMRARGEKEAWLPEAKEAKLSPMEYMDRCNRFLCKLDTLGWKRSFHQNLFHAVCAYARVLFFSFSIRLFLFKKNTARADAARAAWRQDFIRATARSFFKLEKPGTFARLHGQLLQKNNWDCIAQEILISTPRRFGKTISE
jgi:hypothetical protein